LETAGKLEEEEDGWWIGGRGGAKAEVVPRTKNETTNTTSKGEIDMLSKEETETLI